jgi:signal transduction histidine kinase
VLLNLVRNALEAASPLAGAPQDVLVQARRAGPDDLVIRVIDEGAGVEPEAVERVFEPFYTTKPGGLGLGLAISRSIVEAHGGSLRLEPNADRGATFSLTLPGIAEGSP